MLTGRRYRLDFTCEQGEFAERIGGACRSVWNTALEQRRIHRRRGGWIGYHDQARQMAEAKDDFPWLAEVPGHCLQQVLIDLDEACARHGTWKVRWKSRVASPPSFRFPEGGKITVVRISRRWARAKLPKLGWVRFRITRPLGGKAKNATVSRDGGHWYISFLVEDGVTPPERHAQPGSAVGIDRGVVKVVTRSDGRFHHQVFARDREVEYVKKLQRDFARTAKGSARRRKAAGRVAGMVGKVGRRRQDFAAKTAQRVQDGGSEVPREPSGLPVHFVRSHRTRRRERRQERTHRREGGVHTVRNGRVGWGAQTTQPCGPEGEPPSNSSAGHRNSGVRAGWNSPALAVGSASIP
jgi:putative transposase